MAETKTTIEGAESEGFRAMLASVAKQCQDRAHKLRVEAQRQEEMGDPRAEETRRQEATWGDRANYAGAKGTIRWWPGEDQADREYALKFSREIQWAARVGALMTA